MAESRKPREAPLGKRLLWFAALWAGSVAVLGLLAYAIRLALVG